MFSLFFSSLTIPFIDEVVYLVIENDRVNGKI